MKDAYLALMDTSIRNLVSRSCRVALRYPRYLPMALSAARYQGTAAKMRDTERERGLSVPAFLIVSVTRRCNLRCKGCYSHVSAALEAASGRGTELESGGLSRVVAEGTALGVSFVLLAGGEPLVRAADIVALARDNRRVIFPLFTNGSLIDAPMLAAFRRCRNLLPVLSIEGDQADTDSRRGTGVHQSLLVRMRELRKAGIFYGISFTVMRHNLDSLCSADFIRSLVQAGAGLFFYNEYTPVDGGSSGLCIDRDGRDHLLRSIRSLEARFPALFIAFPGDEDAFGGCLAAGRGFLHIAPDGRLEACPFAPFGDSSAASLSLREALASPMLSAIREHHDELEETSGGCSLWNRRAWAEGLVGGKKENDEPDFT